MCTAPAPAPVPAPAPTPFAAAATAATAVHPSIGTCSDWNIVRRVFKHTDGEFWTAGLPLSAVQKQKNQEGGEEGGGEEGGRVSPEDARKAFQRGGFSLVINRLQRRSRSVSRVALALEDVLGQLVNANLYMTPPQRQAFEAHFDWMDGECVRACLLTCSARQHLFSTVPECGVARGFGRYTARLS